MSAWVVTKHHIDLLVSAALERGIAVTFTEPHEETVASHRRDRGRNRPALVGREQHEFRDLSLQPRRQRRSNRLSAGPRRISLSLLPRRSRVRRRAGAYLLRLSGLRTPHLTNIRPPRSSSASSGRPSATRTTPTPSRGASTAKTPFSPQPSLREPPHEPASHEQSSAAGASSPLSAGHIPSRCRILPRLPPHVQASLRPRLLHDLLERHVARHRARRLHPQLTADPARVLSMRRGSPFWRFLQA